MDLPTVDLNTYTMRFKERLLSKNISCSLGAWFPVLKSIRQWTYCYILDYWILLNLINFIHLFKSYWIEMNFIEFWHCAKASLELTTVAGVQTRPWYILHVLLVWITIPNFQEFSWSMEKSVQFCSEQRYRYRYTISSFRIKLWAWQLAMMGSE